MRIETIHIPESEKEKTDLQLRSEEAMCVNNSSIKAPWWHYLKYLAVGMFFGIVLIKSEVISWFRIQEMFRLQSYYMYAVIGSAVITGMISVLLIKKLKLKTIHGEEIRIPDKKFNKGQIYGGIIFGLGWAVTGACPGPLFAQIGTGAFAILLSLVSAIAGTWVFGRFKDRLPS